MKLLDQKIRFSVENPQLVKPKKQMALLLHELNELTADYNANGKGKEWQD